MIKISTFRIASKMKFTSVIFLSIFLSFSHLNTYQLFAQDSDPVDNSVVSNGEKIFKGNCTVCHWDLAVEIISCSEAFTNSKSFEPNNPLTPVIRIFIVQQDIDNHMF